MGNLEWNLERLFKSRMKLLKPGTRYKNSMETAWIKDFSINFHCIDILVEV